FRILKEIIQGIQQQTSKEFSIGVKLNSVDFGRRRKVHESVGGGDKKDNSNKNITFNKELSEDDPDEPVKVAILLEKLGVDFIEISGGGYEAFAAGIMDGKLSKPTESNIGSNKESDKDDHQKKSART